MDGLHPNDKGYGLVAPPVQAAIEKAVGCRQWQRKWISFGHTTRVSDFNDRSYIVVAYVNLLHAWCHPSIRIL
jgi:hypothetical protein